MPELKSDDEREDLLNVLKAFWLERMKDPAEEPSSRMKASENLAKYGLELMGGKTVPKVKVGLLRPPTSEILAMTEMIEQAQRDEDANGED